MKIHLNNDWSFFNPADNSLSVNVRLPHSAVETPFNYFDERVYQNVFKYEKMLQVEKSWEGKALLLTFLAAAHQAKLYVNGIHIYTHNCGYTAFTQDISNYVEYGAQNRISVIVDSRYSLNQPPFGNILDYMAFAGLYREVYLEVKSKTYIAYTHINAQAANENKQAKINVKLEIEAVKHGEMHRVALCIKDSKKQEIFNAAYDVQGPLLNAAAVVSDVVNWSLEDPTLYTLHVSLFKKQASSFVLLDETTESFGFRDAVFKKDGFYLNDKKIKLVGLNRHQSFPYIGYAAPKSIQQLDAQILKHELGVNMVRTAHYPQSKHFVSECDALGILVFTEIPGWQHIGDEKWQAQAVRNTQDMVEQYRNHPSIVLWGVRINESLDNDKFYEKTNASARQLDPYRQTAGVRNIKKSSFLEDVYTFNDFTYGGGKHVLSSKNNVTRNNPPYLVTEYNGHKYPVKSFDDEAQRVEHALRHARVLDKSAGMKKLAGCIAWCMNDYNTNSSFGSGDKICYHGVLDMFRNPKYAAYAYASTSDDKHVLEIASSMAHGDYASSTAECVWAFTNCDSVRLSINGTAINEFYPDRKSFKHLKYAPVRIDDTIGQRLRNEKGFSAFSSYIAKRLLAYAKVHGHEKIPFHKQLPLALVLFMQKLSIEQLVEQLSEYVTTHGEYVFEGIKDGKTVITKTIAPVNKRDLAVFVSNTQLEEQSAYDMACVRVRAVDEHGNILHYANDAVHITVDGAIELVGGNCISLRGGMSGIYVKTKGVNGTGSLSITCGDLHKTIEFDVKVNV